MFKFRKSEIMSLANKLTCNSELFGDEVEAVVCQLSSLSASANKYGCIFTGTVRDCWGNSITVTAIPNRFRDSWTF